eukprot:933469-Lingulodinium_polyedra.AAC.1
MFEDGKLLERVTNSKYLGSILIEGAKNTEEIQHRIVEARKAVKAFEKFWTKARCSKSWKIEVFQAVVTSRLTYGCETIIWHEHLLRKVDAVALAGFRKIL